MYYAKNNREIRICHFKTETVSHYDPLISCRYKPIFGLKYMYSQQGLSISLKKKWSLVEIVFLNSLKIAKIGHSFCRYKCTWNCRCLPQRLLQIDDDFC